MCLSLLVFNFKKRGGKKLLPFHRECQAWLAHWEIREHGRHVARLLLSIRPQMASLTSPVLILQCALCGLHLKKRSRGRLEGGKSVAQWAELLPNSQQSASKHIIWKGAAVDVVQVCTRTECVSSLVSTVRLKFLTHSPLSYPTLINNIASLTFPLSSCSSPYLYSSLISIPSSPPPTSHSFHVQRPESNLQQLSKSGMTDKLIFSS